MAGVELEPSIRLPQATAMVAGIIIGASIFVQPSEINRHVPTTAGVLAVWTAAGILTLFGALVCAELSSAYPRTGGVYIFLKETLSPGCAFLWGWAMFWSVHSGIIAASSVIFARYAGYFFPLGDAGIRAVAIAGILALSALNVLGVRQGASFQTIVTAAKLLAIALLLGVAVVWSSPARAAAVTASAAPTPFREFVLGVAAALYTFGGWHMVTYSAGETHQPRKTIPLSLLIGCLLVTACYIALNGVYLYVLPLDRVVASSRVAADAAAAVAGPRGASVISALVILSSLSVLNGVILAGPRLYLAMARDSSGLRAIAAIHPRFHTPHAAIVLQAVWSAVLVATGTYRVLFTRVIYTEWLFFALLAAGLLLQRRRPNYAPAYRLWGYPFVPIAFIAASLLVAGLSIAADPWQAAAGLALVALGLPVYYFWIRKRSHPKNADN